jgi:hypothetical protein
MDQYRKVMNLNFIISMVKLKVTLDWACNLLWVKQEMNIDFFVGKPLGSELGI